MDLADLRRNWEALGREQPMRAILERRDPWGVEELFATGRDRVDAILAEPSVAGRLRKGRALDFGCGVGRLSQALAEHFEEVVGVDIATSMVELANRYNRFPGRCSYRVSTGRRLVGLDDAGFDFALSLIVLQHVGADLAKGYIGELLRVLRPGGVAFFQLPSERVPPAAMAPEAMAVSVVIATPLDAGDAGAPDCAQWECGSTRDLSVLVRNVSACSWAPDQRVLVGTRWWGSGTGEPVEGFDSRIALPGEVLSGEEVALAVEVHVPRVPGHYRLSIGALQDGVSWFADHGSDELAVEVCAVDASRSGAEALPERREEAAPHMEMCPVPQAEVIAAVEGAGGEVVEVVGTSMAGPGWRDLCYVVSRR